ncbi:MAG: DeoR family transcriptional regulator [Candidatus Cloacimonetes bacterium]|nr:DeoR family transcriptional regulator [Candidatus Cloacimonadota bacterium]
MIQNRDRDILRYIKTNGELSSKEIFEGLSIPVSYATLKRDLKNLVLNEYPMVKGKGRSTRYVISPAYELIQPIDIQKYYEKEIDEREIKQKFNFQVAAQ